MVPKRLLGHHRLAETPTLSCRPLARSCLTVIRLQIRIQVKSPYWAGRAIIKS